MGTEVMTMQFATFEAYEQAFDKQWMENTQKASELVEGFMKIGYLLKMARDTDILNDTGYSDYIDFARRKYDIGKDVVSRYININNTFSEGGNSMILEERYRGFGYAKLALMLTLPEQIREEITPEYSKSEIQAIKDELDEEAKISDIEVVLEGQKPEQYGMSNIEKVLHQMFLDDPELFREVFDGCKGEADNQKALYEILAPIGEKMYSVRIAGVGRFSVFVKKDGVAMVNVREGDKENFNWSEISNVLFAFLNASSSPKEAWENIYGEIFPEKKVEVAPVQQAPKQAPRKESKVKKSPKPEPKKLVQKKEPIVQQEEKDAKENEAESEIIPVEPESEHVEISEVREDPDGAESDEQHCEMSVQRQSRKEQLEDNIAELVEEIQDDLEILSAAVKGKRWNVVKRRLSDIKSDVELIEKLESEIEDLQDTSQMRLEDYEQKEE